mgnify:CR=1 FL=1
MNIGNDAYYTVEMVLWRTNIKCITCMKYHTSSEAACHLRFDDTKV